MKKIIHKEVLRRAANDRKETLEIDRTYYEEGKQHNSKASP